MIYYLYNRKICRNFRCNRKDTTMILRATFENIYSFKEETSVSFVAGKGSLHPAHVSRAQKRDDISALLARQI